MNELKVTGGAHIGRRKATYPFASLKVTPDKLVLKVSMIGTFRFSADDIISIETIETTLGLGSGLRIIHNVEGYNAHIQFYSTRSTELLLDEISYLGFTPEGVAGQKASDNTQKKRPTIKGSAIKTTVTIIGVVLWNLLFLSQFAPMFLELDYGFDHGVRVALGGVIFFSILSLVSSDFRRIILKEGRDLSDIKYGLLFIIGICTVLLICTTIMGF